MRITVYHLTSSIFITSIKERGLISTDIRQKLPQLCYAMNDIIKVLEQKHRDFGYDWGEPAGFHDNCQRMADRDYKNCSGMDFEYGNVYVTPSKTRISIYNNYEFGSELITYFYRLYRCLFWKFNDKSKEDFDAKYPELVSIIRIKDKKNLILMSQVDTEDLLTDTGNQLDEGEMDLIQFMVEKYDGDVQRSYRMKRTLYPGELEVMTIENKNFLAFGKLSEYIIPDNWNQVVL